MSEQLQIWLFGASFLLTGSALVHFIMYKDRTDKRMGALELNNVVNYTEIKNKLDNLHEDNKEIKARFDLYMKDENSYLKNQQTLMVETLKDIIKK